MASQHGDTRTTSQHEGYLTANPNVVMWGSYPVNSDHVMGAPTLVNANIGYRLDSPNIWPGVTNRSVCYTGRCMHDVLRGSSVATCLLPAYKGGLDKISPAHVHTFARNYWVGIDMHT
jgi:hypothetical protein